MSSYFKRKGLSRLRFLGSSTAPSRPSSTSVADAGQGSHDKANKASEPDWNDLSPKEKRRIGTIENDWEFLERAALRLWTARRWIPALSVWVMACAILSVGALLITAGSIYTKPPPLVWLSHSDGRLRCAPPQVDIRSLKPLPRRPADQALCNRFEPSPPQITRYVMPPEIDQALLEPGSLLGPDEIEPAQSDQGSQQPTQAPTQAPTHDAGAPMSSVEQPRVHVGVTVP